MKNERNQEIDMTWKYAFKQSLPIMGMLVIYCLRNASLVTAPHGLPDFWFFN